VAQFSVGGNTARHQKSKIAQELLAMEGQLDGAFPGQEWRVQWRQNPREFVSQCSENAHAWVEHQTCVTILASSMTALQVEIGACEKACLQATAQLMSQTESLDAVESVLQTYRTSRSSLFEGCPVAEVEAALNAAIQVAKLALAESQAALHKAQAEVTRTMEAVRQSETLLEQHRIAIKEAHLALDTWLAAFNVQARGLGASSDLELGALEALLQIAPEWATGEREVLQLLERASTTAQAVLDTRTHSRTAHEADKTVVEELDVLQEDLAQLLVTIGSVTEALANLKLEIAKDDERLAASGSLRVKIDKQGAISKVWSQLSELIGSADGKKFRNFAQQLTLDILLNYGNQHLQSLTRRYRLQRIKDSLGLLVVDQDMGDEVRSVHSLSGGESFLVSLALALGLASLSSHKVQVESLFIDEGFGSLDADSLSIAMDALDNLQSQGRKVGVISHVQEMTERIGTRVQVQRQAGGLSRISVC
jgi:exonuclease SbcC